MKMKRWIVLGTIFLLMIGCNGEPEIVEFGGPPAEETVTPTLLPEPEGIAILADGVVQAAQPALDLAFDTGGKLGVLHVQAGDQVSSGDLLAELEQAAPIDSFETAVTTAELGVLRAEQTINDLYANAEIARTEALNEIAEYAKAARDAQYQIENYSMPIYLQGLGTIEALDKTRSQLDAASAAFEPYRYFEATNPVRRERLEALNDAQSQYNAAVKRLQIDYEFQVAQANLDKARADYDEYTAGPTSDELTLAEAELANAQAQLAFAQNDLQRAIEAQNDIYLMAPWSGTVLSVDVAPGALVASGVPVMSLLDSTQLEFHTTNVSERDLALIQPGQKAVVTLKAYPDQPLDARVLRVGWQVGEAVGDAATFPILLSMIGTGLDLRPGMTGRVEIYTQE